MLAIVASLTVYIKKNPVNDNQVITLTRLTSDQVDTIVIQRADQTQIIFEKDDQGWLITSPIEKNPDPEKIKSLLKFLNLKSRHQHKITEQKQLKRYELLDPGITIFFNNEQFDFGNTNDFNHLRYVLHEGVVHSVKDITRYLLVLDAESFIVKNVE